MTKKFHSMNCALRRDGRECTCGLTPSRKTENHIRLYKCEKCGCHLGYMVTTQVNSRLLIGNAFVTAGFCASCDHPFRVSDKDSEKEV